MRPIFNSLGSNYTTHNVFSAIKQLMFSNQNYVNLLQAKLCSDSSNQAVLVYKGRDAIEFALSALLPKRAKVITQAFSCYAIEEGFVRADMIPVYCDIRGEVHVQNGKWYSTNMDLKSIQNVYKTNPDCKAVFVQHSLGIPADILEISEWCRKNNILLIEDLAQAFGGTDTQGNILGMSADAVIYSFGRDKIIDAVSGGAVVFSNPSLMVKEKILTLKRDLKPVSKLQIIQEMLYPLATFFIRKTSQYLIGKVVFVILKKVGFLNSPVLSPYADSRYLDGSYAALALQKISTIQQQLDHRRAISNEYYSRFCNSNSEHFIFSVPKNHVQNASNIRFSIVFYDSEVVRQVIKNLEKQQVYVSDRWYRNPVDSGSLNIKSVYVPQSCPNAEYVCQRVLNLPTHLGIEKVDVQRISDSILKTVGEL